MIVVHLLKKMKYFMMINKMNANAELSLSESLRELNSWYDERLEAIQKSMSSPSVLQWIEDNNRSRNDMLNSLVSQLAAVYDNRFNAIMDSGNFRYG